MGIGFNYLDISGFVYYDAFARPKQTSQHVEIIQANAFDNLVTGNWHFDNVVNFQKFYQIQAGHLPYFVDSIFQ